MAQQEIDYQKLIWKFYHDEIIFFEKKTTELFLKTILHETGIEKMKQHKLRISEEDIDKLVELLSLSLKAIAIVETYKYFQSQMIPPSEENNELFYDLRDQHFERLLIIFFLKVKAAEEIDFSISR